jgi:hypothetical protein
MFLQESNWSKTRIGSLLIASFAVYLFAAMININVLAAARQGGEKLKSEAQQTLDRILQNLKDLDTAYASGNTAEAQSKYDTALTDWKKLSPQISAREARESNLLFDSLGKKLKDKAPAKDVSTTVNGMMGEMRRDIQREVNGERGERGEREERNERK